MDKVKIRNRITFSTKGLIRKDRKILMVRRSYPDPSIWELPGGHLKYGESAEEAVSREIWEEIGLKIRPMQLLDTWDSFLPPRWQITGVLFLCDAQSFDIRLSDEHSEYRWVSPEQEDFQLLSPVFRDRMIRWDWDEIFSIPENQ